ncbi:hypothetical protein Hanom_Chr03g00234261 [Helianthus anomalus]
MGLVQCWVGRGDIDWKFRAHQTISCVVGEKGGLQRVADSCKFTLF